MTHEDITKKEYLDYLKYNNSYIPLRKKINKLFTLIDQKYLSVYLPKSTYLFTEKI